MNSKWWHQLLLLCLLSLIGDSNSRFLLSLESRFVPFLFKLQTCKGRNVNFVCCFLLEIYVFSLRFSFPSSPLFCLSLCRPYIKLTAADRATHLFSFLMQRAVTGTVTTQICADITSVMEDAAARCSVSWLTVSDPIAQAEGSRHTDVLWHAVARLR